MIPVVRTAVRFLALALGVVVLALGIVSDALPKEQTDTSPPDDSRWLVSLGIAFLLLMVFSILTVSGDPLRRGNTPEERFRANVRQLGGFLLVGFVLLSLHLLREQVVAAASIKQATVVTASGSVIQDPRKIPDELQIRRGAIYARDRVVAASEVITPAR